MEVLVVVLCIVAAALLAEFLYVLYLLWSISKPAPTPDLITTDLLESVDGKLSLQLESDAELKVLCQQVIDRLSEEIDADTLLDINKCDCDAETVCPACWYAKELPEDCSNCLVAGRCLGEAECPEQTPTTSCGVRGCPVCGIECKGVLNGAEDDIKQAMASYKQWYDEKYQQPDTINQQVTIWDGQWEMTKHYFNTDDWEVRQTENGLEVVKKTAVTEEDGNKTNTPPQLKGSVGSGGVQ